MNTTYCAFQIRLRAPAGHVWEFCTAQIAAVAACAGVPVRLQELPVGPKLVVKRWRAYQTRVATPRRVAAASGALRAERRAAPMFAKEIEAAQPTPLQRIEAADARSREIARKVRDARAAAWKGARAQMRSLSQHQHDLAVVLFNSHFSDDPSSLARIAQMVAAEYPWREKKTGVA